MKLFFHYCSFGFSNCYVLGTDYGCEDLQTSMFAGETPSHREAATPRESATPREAAPPREAIIIDPGNMDKTILDFIEQNNYKLSGVLVTHDHLNHVHGLRTLKHIYDVEIYAVNHIILDNKTTMVKDGDTFNIGSFHVEVISVPGHSSDSAVYKINHMLFTGDALNAGMLGTTASSYGAEVQMTAIRSKIFSLPGNYVVLPGHGPPSTLETERRFNAGIQIFEQHKKRRPSFDVETWED
ncbi:hydroxyacylglutathione hydrolase (Glyoxalase II) (GlxII) [Treponema primitia ZAS-2]|uniref:Hydroxyacylglutathione hydrolase (Glyoxalase II) (GlxII) n=1 Tax=Treponema primitia (strain ATCC BAA-887 / DSM 12427 / ZAS-2) TaxID=545694 RepID=F5YIG4_TREPZ|nr:MBL fold metallo-hydrolase [Treponema primitia]AEF84445.1 hydroxyacylglutathione hydrolase (Glyoxalase II) (GlxII) [Treponema primitia ZAS-2]